MREGTWVVLGQIGVVLINVVALRLFTGLMSAEMFGKANLMIAAIIFGRSIMVTPFSFAQIRFHPEYALKHKVRWFDAQITRLTLMSSSIYALIGAVAFVVWCQIYKGGVEFWMLAAALTYLMSETFKNMRSNRLMAERRQKLYSGWEVADAFLTLVVTVLMLTLWKSAACYVMALSIAEWIGVFLFGYLWMPALAQDSDEPPEPRTVLLGKIVRYGSAFVPMAILTWPATLGDRFVLDHLMGIGAVGYYAAATAIGSKPFSMVGGIFTTLLRPILFEAQSKGDTAKAHNTFMLWLLGTCLVGFLGVVSIWLLRVPICWLLLAPKFRGGAVDLLPWVAIAYATSIFTHSIENRLLSLNRSAGLIMPQVVQAVVAIGLAFVLIPRFGVIGAAQAKTIANLLQFALAGATMMYYLRSSRPQAE